MSKIMSRPFVILHFWKEVEGGGDKECHDDVCNNNGNFR